MKSFGSRLRSLRRSSHHVIRRPCFELFSQKKNMPLEITTVETTPFAGQKPGTSGLRKKTTVFQQPNYLENFVQCVFNVLDPSKLDGSTLVVGGDGRYLCPEAALTVCRIAAAHGVKRCWVGRKALISTPCVSHIIRERENGVAYGGFILTASHNPGGPDEDFGVRALPIMFKCQSSAFNQIQL